MKHLLLLAFSLIAGIIPAQQFHFRHIGTDKGLPSSESYHALQDSKGYLWFTTNAGIARYNGNSFRYFTMANGLPDNTVFELFEDKKGRIWFNTISCNIGYIYNDSVTVVAANKKLREYLLEGQLLIYYIHEDNGDIILTTAMGTLRITEKSNFTEVAPVINACDSCYFVAKELPDGRCIIGVSHNAYKVGVAYHDKLNIALEKGGTTAVYSYKTRGHLLRWPDIWAALQDDGTLLISIYEDVIHFKPNGTTDKTHFANKLLYLSRGPGKSLWVSSYTNGLYCYPNGDLNEQPVISLRGLSISSLLFDHEGGVWATTLEKGVFYSPTLNITDFQYVPGLGEKISALGTHRNKVLVSNFQPKVFVISNGKHDTSAPALTTPPPFSIVGVSSFPDKILFAGSHPMSADTGLTKLKRVYLKNTNLSSLIYQTVRAPDGRIYGINHANLCQFDDDMVIIDTLPARGRCIEITSTGDIYVGTVSGMFRYDGEQFIPLSRDHRFMGNKISFIKKGPEDELWIGTEGGGLGIYNGKKLEVIGEEKGAPSGNCNALVFDWDGTAWLATNKGICRITAGDHSLRLLNTSDGLISNEVLHLAINGNKLYAGTTAGLCTIDLSKDLFNNTPPPVHIRSVVMNDSVLDWRSATVFTHTQNNLRFVLDGLSFRNSDDISFTYRLLPLDTAWNITRVNEISFTTLPPGNYRLEAKSINNNGIASSRPVIAEFTILKPFWAEWWFIVLCIILAALVVFLFILDRLRSVRKKEAEKTRINKLIAEYQMNALRAQMNPHFIFNAINSIQNFILDKNTQEAYDYLAKFSKLIRLVLNNAQEQSLTLEKDLEMLLLYIELEQLRFRNSFDLQFSIDEQIDSGGLKIPAMLIQPFVENAIWHGIMPLEGKRTGKLTLSLKQEKSLLKITVEDNGIGRERSRQIKKSLDHKSLGMLLSQKRVEMLGNTPEGERPRINITDLTGNEGPCGTKVEIFVPLLE